MPWVKVFVKIESAKKKRVSNAHPLVMFFSFII